MRAMEVFYHYFVPPDLRARYASWWLDSQLTKIRESGLSNYAKINMCISMPVHWWYDDVTWFTTNLTNETVAFVDKTIEYIESRYPFVNIIQIENNFNPGSEYVNIYEGLTIQHMHKRCQEKMIYCLYMHNKGASSHSYTVSNWRETVEYYLITNWKKCVEFLEKDEIDIVAVKDLYDHVPGSNFYWSKSEHIANLLEPLDSSKYLDESQQEVWPGTPGYRYCFERWPMTNGARMHWIKETNCPTSYSFVEFPQSK